MASRGQSVTVTFVAWDTSTSAPKTGDVANFTLRWIKDGTSGVPTNSPAEVDSVDVPGVYKLVLTTAECTADVGTLAGKSSTSGVVILPVTITFESTADAADKLIGRNIAGSADGGRTVGQALAASRNKVAFDVPSVGSFTVFAVDDSTPLWVGTYTTAAGNPVTVIDPA